jgi:hypothetical protein
LLDAFLGHAPRLESNGKAKNFESADVEKDMFGKLSLNCPDHRNDSVLDNKCNGIYCVKGNKWQARIKFDGKVYARPSRMSLKQATQDYDKLVEKFALDPAPELPNGHMDSSQTALKSTIVKKGMCTESAFVGKRVCRRVQDLLQIGVIDGFDPDTCMCVNYFSIGVCMAISTFEYSTKLTIAYHSRIILHIQGTISPSCVEKKILWELKRSSVCSMTIHFSMEFLLYSVSILQIQKHNV